MEILAVLLLPAVLVWGAVIVKQTAVPVWATLFVITTVVFPAEFLAWQAAGLTWTLDRCLLIALLVSFAAAWWQGQARLPTWRLADLTLALFFLWLVARTLTQPWGSIAPHQPPTLMHLINGYGVPVSLYCVLRWSRLSGRQLRISFWMLMALGLYLSVTAVLEIAKLWGWVYPRFIADPELGIHFGRARGPLLQSVRLGMCLLGCWAAAVIFTIWLRPRSKAAWVFLLVTSPIYLAAVMATYTRSIWMGLGLVSGLLVVCCLSGWARRSLIVGGAMVAVLLACLAGPSLVAFKREYSEAETRESTYMRAAFAYVSWQMIKERPVAGFGFNQFNIANREFLSDRRTEIRLESIRDYVHHNSFLSLLVDLGLIGFALFCLMMICFIRESWQLWRSTVAEDWARGIGLLALCLTGVHLIQMAFHEVSFSPVEHGLLLGCYGLVIAARQACQVDGARSVRDWRDHWQAPQVGELGERCPWPTAR